MLPTSVEGESEEGGGSDEEGTKAAGAGFWLKLPYPVDPPRCFDELSR